MEFVKMGNFHHRIFSITELVVDLDIFFVVASDAAHAPNFIKWTNHPL
jgi:hypothetical protein